MPSPVLSFRTDEEMLSKLDQLAEATERDRQYHLKRALSRYLDAELWHLQAIAEGIADADANNLTDLNSVKEKWVKRAENSPD
ncbi:CopG family ribbon-helix-helix protein [Pseudomonas sp. UBA1879]|uniref:CopG family ribbon-helix-helix protein n=1 Tax=Pseudomonas sp. UBA1879 TaxID=1947305 RepID=UPI0025F005DA|nr:ribbon-helix-helix protein, CopG family [Pseudomonas sp. UBA1879]